MSADRTPGLPTRGALVPRRRRTPLGGPSGDCGGRAKTLAGCTGPPDTARRSNGFPRTTEDCSVTVAATGGRSRTVTPQACPRPPYRDQPGALRVLETRSDTHQFLRAACPSRNRGIRRTGRRTGRRTARCPLPVRPRPVGRRRCPLRLAPARVWQFVGHGLAVPSRVSHTFARNQRSTTPPQNTSCYKATAGAFGGRRPGRRHRVPAGHPARHPHPARRRVRRPPPVRGGPCLPQVMPRRHAARLTDNRITPQGR